MTPQVFQFELKCILFFVGEQTGFQLHYNARRRPLGSNFQVTATRHFLNTKIARNTPYNRYFFVKNPVVPPFFCARIGAVFAGGDCVFARSWVSWGYSDQTIHWHKNPLTNTLLLL